MALKLWKVSHIWVSISVFGSYSTRIDLIYICFTQEWSISKRCWVEFSFLSSCNIISIRDNSTIAHGGWKRGKLLSPAMQDLIKNNSLHWPKRRTFRESSYRQNIHELNLLDNSSTVISLAPASARPQPEQAAVLALSTSHKMVPGSLVGITLM